MTEKIKKVAKENNFKIIEQRDPYMGIKIYLKKENVLIFIERWDNTSGWWRRPEKDVLLDINNFHELKKWADWKTEYDKKIEREMLGC